LAEIPNLKKERRGRFFAYAPLFIWIAVILILGSGPGASAQTSRFIRPLIEFFFPDASPDTFLLVHGFIRKAAHFIEYAVLALLARRALSYSGIARSVKYRFLLPLAITAAVAGVDEVNQSFQSSRTSSGWDVLLDIAGGFSALILLDVFRPRKLSIDGNNFGKEQE
jgi:VanZ family protein